MKKLGINSFIRARGYIQYVDKIKLDNKECGPFLPGFYNNPKRNFTLQNKTKK